MKWMQKLKSQNVKIIASIKPKKSNAYNKSSLSVADPEKIPASPPPRDLRTMFTSIRCSKNMKRRNTSNKTELVKSLT